MISFLLKQAKLMQAPTLQRLAKTVPPIAYRGRLFLPLLTMMLTTATATAAVGDVVDSGTCGDNLTWTLTENEDDAVEWANGTTGHTALTLTITGTGAMADYAYQGAPWNSDKQSITVLELPEGLTTVGDYAFDSFFNVKSITLPAAVTSIGQRGFYGGGNKTSSGCTFTAAAGSQLSSIGIYAFLNFGGDVDLRNCTSLTSIGADVFKRYRKKTLYLPVSMRTIAANAIYPESTTTSYKPKVYVAYDNSVVYANGTYKGYGTDTGDVAITSTFNIEKESSAAVSINQICFDDIALTWDNDDHYFEIADEQDLIDLANYVSGSSDRGCEGVTFKMTADLDFSEISHTAVNNIYGKGNFMPIGMISERFLGHFDGQGHTITGLYFSAGGYSTGLFGDVSSLAVIENVTLVGPEMISLSVVGGIVGWLRGGNATATVSNCAVVNGKLKSEQDDCGGIVGTASTNSAIITGCTVVNTSVSGYDDTGIVIGERGSACSSLNISNCTYHNPDGLPVLDDGSYTDGGGNQRVYQLTLGDGITTSSETTFSYGDDLYYASGTDATVTATVPSTGMKKFTATGTTASLTETLGQYTLSMPANDVTVSLADVTPTITVAGGSTYTGSAQTPDVTSVMDGETAMTAGTDYTNVAYSNNINAGEATVSITGMGFYLGTASQTFTIAPASVTLTANSDTKAYNGAAQIVEGFTCNVDGLTFTGVTASGSGTNTGNYDVTFTGVTINTTKDDTGNYVVTATTNGTLTITAAITNYGAAKITWNESGKTATFDGTSVATIGITEYVAVDAIELNRAFTVDKTATIMLPFGIEVNKVSGADFYTFTAVEKEEGKWVATMTKVEDALTANTPYLVMPSATSLTFTGGATLNTTGGGNQQTAESGSHWTFKGTYEARYWYDGTDGNHAAQNADEIGKVYGFAGVQKTGIEVGDFVRVASGAKIRPMGCYLLWNDTPNTARSMTRGEAAEELPQRITVRLVSRNGVTTDIGTIDTRTSEFTFDSWYSLDGVKLNGKPSKKGLYIHNGRKEVIR